MSARLSAGRLRTTYAFLTAHRTHRLERLMRAHQLRALHGHGMRRWSVGTPAMLIPNILQRQFTVTRPNKAWVTDITYIRTWQGWLYVAVVLDLFGIGIPIGVAEVWRGSARRARGPRAVLVLVTYWGAQYLIASSVEAPPGPGRAHDGAPAAA